MNQGTIAFDGAGNGTNESTALTDDPDVAGGTNPTTFSVAGTGVVAVPTLSPVALVFAAAVLLAFASIRLRRRR